MFSAYRTLPSPSRRMSLHGAGAAGASAPTNTPLGSPFSAGFSGFDSPPDAPAGSPVNLSSPLLFSQAPSPGWAGLLDEAAGEDSLAFDADKLRANSALPATSLQQRASSTVIGADMTVLDFMQGVEFAKSADDSTALTANTTVDGSLGSGNGKCVPCDDAFCFVLWTVFGLL